jgi:hypothetical protein
MTHVIVRKRVKMTSKNMIAIVHAGAETVDPRFEVIADVLESGNNLIPTGSN